MNWFKVKNEGSALVLTLVIVILVTLISLSLFQQRQLDIKRTKWLLQDDQASILAQNALFAAKDYLANSLIKAAEEPGIEKNHVSIIATENTGDYVVNTVIYDQQALFNMNELITNQDYIRLRLFFNAVTPTLAMQTIESLMEQSLKFMSNDSGTQQTLPPRDLFSIHELPAYLHQFVLNDQLTVLPRGMSLNINTASKSALASISPTLTEADVDQIIAFRDKQNGFKSIEEFLKLPMLAKNVLLTKRFTLLSDYFLISTSIRKQADNWRFQTLLFRKKLDGKTTLTAIWQSQG